MRPFIFLCVLATPLLAAAESDAARLWADLNAKRQTAAPFRQEFEVTEATGTRSSTRRIMVEWSQEKWRATSVSGSGTLLTYFDGTGLFHMEKGCDEFTRVKSKSKTERPVPEPYEIADADWSKAIEKDRRKCGIKGKEHDCVVVEAPLKPWIKLIGTSPIKLIEGHQVMLLDLENGLVMNSRIAEIVDRGGYRFSHSVQYSAKWMTYNAVLEAHLFSPPDGAVREVKKLSQWTVEKINKQLGGKPAPEFEFISLTGQQLSLAALKGKPVLLDFWTSWCPPCRADAPALERLYQKYSAHDLMIIGISVSEERKVVEAFLAKYPHSYPIVLTAENEVPRPYQVGAFPTYILINKDGLITEAVLGDRGFGALRKLLQKAGLDTE